jgi:hypothetical protein
MYKVMDSEDGGQAAFFVLVIVILTFIFGNLFIVVITEAFSRAKGTAQQATKEQA